MRRDRSLLSSLAIYTLAIGMLTAGTAGGLIWAVGGSAALSGTPDREKTLLDQRVENARAVRRALAKPIPPPAPLPPITAKLEHPSKTAGLKRTRPVLTDEARNAFASIDMNTNVDTSRALSYDRHAPQ